MIKAENSGCCQRLCFLATGWFSKAAPSCGCTAEGGRWAVKALDSCPLPTHLPKDGHSWALTAQQVAETSTENCAGAFLLLKRLWSLQELHCVRGGDPRGDDPGSGVSLMLLNSVPPPLPGCISESLHVSYKPQDCLIHTPSTHHGFCYLQKPFSCFSVST